MPSVVVRMSGGQVTGDLNLHDPPSYQTTILITVAGRLGSLLISSSLLHYCVILSVDASIHTAKLITTVVSDPPCSLNVSNASECLKTESTAFNSPKWHQEQSTYI